jgi:hypothetical protein
MMKRKFILICSFALILAVVLPGFGQSSGDDETKPAQSTVQKNKKKKNKGSAREIGQGGKDIGKGAAKGSVDLASGAAGGVANLATGSPVAAGASVGKGAVGFGKNVGVGTAKGVFKIGRGIGGGLKKIGRKSSKKDEQAQ